jgi:hypothetical protein
MLRDLFVSRPNEHHPSCKYGRLIIILTLATALSAGCWLLAAGCWLLAAGCWLLAAGCWLLAAVWCLLHSVF